MTSLPPTRLFPVAGRMLAGRRPREAGAGTATLEPVADRPPLSAPHPQDADAQLLRRLHLRDEAALGLLYDRHSGSVYALLLRLLDQHSAQEVVQDVFLRLWQAPERFDPARGELRSFLVVMARSRALDRLRRERGEWRLYDEQGQDFPLPDERQSPFDQAARVQTRDQLTRAMARLSDAHRETIRRAFLLGESREETARQMGVPVGTVKSRLNSALHQMKKLMGAQAGSGHGERDD
ncbi:MAG: RNA polymerase sigma factor [Deinococcus sp.]